MLGCQTPGPTRHLCPLRSGDKVQKWFYIGKTMQRGIFKKARGSGQKDLAVSPRPAVESCLAAALPGGLQLPALCGPQFAL